MVYTINVKKTFFLDFLHPVVATMKFTRIKKSKGIYSMKLNLKITVNDKF